jgi:hypothetical protein
LWYFLKLRQGVPLQKIKFPKSDVRHTILFSFGLCGKELACAKPPTAHAQDGRAPRSARFVQKQHTLLPDSSAVCYSGFRRPFCKHFLRHAQDFSDASPKQAAAIVCASIR